MSLLQANGTMQLERTPNRSISMAIEFDCFLIDEAMVAGDLRFHERCHNELFVKRKDRAFILVTHDTEVMKALCENVSVLHQGRLIPFASVDAAVDFYRASVAEQRAEIQPV